MCYKGQVCACRRYAVPPLGHKPPNGMNLESLRRRLSSDEINALPLCHYEGPIHLVRSLEDWEKALPDLQQEQVLGFDTETRPSFRKGRVNTPSLVQLATARAVYLVQLSWWPFGPELAGLLADPAVIKAGVAIGDDMRELARLYPFKPAGMVDLGMVARAHQLTTQGLRTLAANLFGHPQRVFCPDAYAMPCGSDPGLLPAGRPPYLHSVFLNVPDF